MADFTPSIARPCPVRVRLCSSMSPPSPMPETPLSELLSPAILSRISDYHLLAKTAVEGLISGLHRSRCRGTGSEFMQYRSYAPGDDLKYLDWKLLARQGKACSKVYQEETNLRCAILLDASASMAYQGDKAPCSKFRYAAMIAACLAYLARSQGDQAGIFVYSDTMKMATPPGSHAGSLPKILAGLERISPDGKADHALALRQSEEYLKGRSLVIWLSDFQGFEDQLGKALRRFRFSGHDGLVCQILDEDELTLPFNETLRFVDSESNHEITTTSNLIRDVYKKRMNDFLDRTRKHCLDQQTDYLLAASSDNIGYLLSAWLHKREGLR